MDNSQRSPEPSARLTPNFHPALLLGGAQLWSPPPHRSPFCVFSLFYLVELLESIYPSPLPLVSRVKLRSGSSGNNKDLIKPGREQQWELYPGVELNFPWKCHQPSKGTLAGGLHLNSGCNFLIILHPDSGRGRLGGFGEGGDIGKMDLLRGKHSHHVVWGWFFVFLPSSRFGLGADVGTRIKESNPNPAPPARSHGWIWAKTSFALGWVGVP